MPDVTDKPGPKERRCCCCGDVFAGDPARRLRRVDVQDRTGAEFPLDVEFAVTGPGPVCPDCAADALRRAV